MKRIIAAILVLSLFGCASRGKDTPPPAQQSGTAAKPVQTVPWEKVQIPSLETTGIFGHPVVVDAYLFRPRSEGPRPAVVMLHGCGGMLTPNGSINAFYRAWGKRLADEGYVVLVVDSFSARGVTNLCSPATFVNSVYLARPKDAYGALRYLQAQPFVQQDRIGLIGWSQGGGTVLLSIFRDNSLGRPDALPQGDFRAAVAFYPGSCDAQRLHAMRAVGSTKWTTRIPLLVLIGDQDVWTPAAPCKELMDSAAAEGSPVDVHLYPGAYHSFDSPGQVKPHERPEYTTRAGVIPITGPDPAARADAYDRVPEFLGRYLGG